MNIKDKLNEFCMELECLEENLWVIRNKGDNLIEVLICYDGYDVNFYIIQEYGFISNKFLKILNEIKEIMVKYFG